ncbi:MAG: anti-sigma factor [Chloroflexi bacterium]|nr:anti-sigma factor [Chloroflexota bacterium]MCI0888669.1 anti-sigma factor [Chloroflexota bacterium]
MVQGPGGSPQDSIEELLPAYALNALDADEREIVDRALAESPRYRAALAGYLEGFAQLAESQVVLLPSLDLRDRIMAAAGAQGPARLATERGRRETPRPAFRGLWAAAAAASVLVFVGLGGLAMAQSSRVNDLEAEMEGLSASAAATEANLDGQREDMATLTATAAATQAMLDGQLDEMAVLQETAADTEAKLISQQELTYFVAHESTSLTRMWAMATPEPSAKPARGMLIADPDGGQLLMTLFLRPLGSSQAYQAWVWESDESAFSIAVFAVDKSGYALVRVDFPGGDVNVNWVSVNIAPAGGEPTPTGQPVLAGPVEFR